MQCLVCSNELTKGEAKCSRCGFPVIYFTEEDGAGLKAVKKLAEQYRKEHWANAKVFLTVYQNKMGSNSVEIEREESILLADLQESRAGEIKWYPENFARLTGDCTLKIAVEYNDGRRESRELKVGNPNTDDFWHVGVKLLDGSRFSLVLGSENRYSESEPVAFA